MSKEEKQRLIEEAQKTLEAHEFKQLATWGDGGSEVWECSRPGSSVYAFTICITRMGIAVVGDIDGLTFNVGSNYGMSFLAGNDVSYYIQSKLEASSRQKELYRERYLEWVATCVVNHIASNFLDDLKEVGIHIPDWLTEDTEDYEDFQKLYDFVYFVWQNIEGGHDLWDWFYACYNTLESADGAMEIHEAYALPDLPGVDFAWFDAHALERSSENLMTRLYLVNEAAKRIMAQKEALAA
jgi:hypothetical protein